MKLKKICETEFDPLNPWTEDATARRPIAELLTRLIQSITQPFVICLNSPWGTGKTHFIKKLIAHMESESIKLPCVYFNAWESDFSKDSLLAFIGELRNELSRLNKSLSPMENGYDAFFESARKIIRHKKRDLLKIGIRGITKKVVGKDG